MIAHGSRSEPANLAHHETCRQLAERRGVPVYAAFLELATPSLDEAVGAAAGDGHHRLAVLPYFLYPGRHSREDIPRLVDEAAAVHAGVELALLPIFGADPAVLDLLGSQFGGRLGSPTMGADADA